MKEHSLSVMTLEEYEPNREFVGRNFNAGEIIQLVLKARSGHWLPFNYVQMVMMHELAHCKQMNHSRAFWAVRNQYAEQMKKLWTRGYTGDGLWGRGALLSSGEFERNTISPDEALPEHLCGGTYRSRRRKRKAKKDLTYQEKKERRILKKFGANGVALGGDDATKRKLEKGKTIAAKPRIAGSNRGRELRAAAALARFEQQSKETGVEKHYVVDVDDDETVSDSETQSESDYEDGSFDISNDAIDINGTKLLDGKGHRMVKVCEDENTNDQDAQQELKELQSSLRNKPLSQVRTAGAEFGSTSTSQSSSKKQDRAHSGKRDAEQIDVTLQSDNRRSPSRTIISKSTQSVNKRTTLQSSSDAGAGRECPICSFTNEPLSITCSMCSNVLDAESVPGSWKCEKPSCKESIYLNAGDCGVCGICGQRKDLNG